MGASLTRAGRLLALIGLALRAGCGESAARRVGELPTVPIAAPAPGTATARPAASVPPAPTPALTAAIPSPTAALTPTFVAWRDPRGAFAIDLPANWHNQPVPQGIGVTSVAFNGLATFSLSFGYQEAPLGEEAARQLAETTRDRLLGDGLIKDPQFSGEARDDGYVLRGSATINALPMAIEVTVRRTAGGALALESWRAPLDLWPEVQRQYAQPMRASLTIDDEALRALR
ncbi:MAG TPA: hypothetical protein VGE07_08040 [Herpetosiphonaceae bacterium]